MFPWQHSNGERRAIQILLKEELHHEKQAEWDEGRKNGRTSWNEDMERRTDSERERVKDSEWHKDKQIERQARHKFTCHIVIQDIVAMTTFKGFFYHAVDIYNPSGDIFTLILWEKLTSSVYLGFCHLGALFLLHVWHVSNLHKPASRLLIDYLKNGISFNRCLSYGLLKRKTKSAISNLQQRGQDLRCRTASWSIT